MLLVGRHEWHVASKYFRFKASLEGDSRPLKCCSMCALSHHISLSGFVCMLSLQLMHDWIAVPIVCSYHTMFAKYCDSLVLGFESFST